MEKQVKLLLVDDDERNIFALSAYLKVKKYLVSTAKDGQECLTKLSESDYDVILLDMTLSTPQVLNVANAFELSADNR